MNVWKAAEQRYYNDKQRLAMHIWEISETATNITISGTTVTVSHEEGRSIMEMNHAEFNTTHRETRRHVSLESYDPNDVRLVSDESDPLEQLCCREQIEMLHTAIAQLTAEQQRLVHRIFWNQEKQSDIAAEEGVSSAAIHYRLDVILRHLRNFFEIRT